MRQHLRTDALLMAKKNGKNLVIVESPAKAKTINKYLGDDFIVKASMGHVRDLPSKGMGVDLKTFEPEYEILESRGKVVSELKKLAKDAPDIYLATDLDREGEAIAWHLKEALGIPDDTRQARHLQRHHQEPRSRRRSRTRTEIDIDRVNAQQARRILDRIVGYEISPAAVAQGRQGLERRPRAERRGAAGRRARARDRGVRPRGVLEDRRRSSPPTAADCVELAGKWIDFLTNTGNGERTKLEREKWLAEHDAFDAELVELAGKKFEADNKADARKAAELLGFVVDKREHHRRRRGQGPGEEPHRAAPARSAQCPPFTVRSIEKKRTTSKPPAPFITSTLQQARLEPPELRRTADDARGADAVRGRPHHLHAYRLDEPVGRRARRWPASYIENEFGDEYLPGEAQLLRVSRTRARRKPTRRSARPTRPSRPQDAHAKLGADESKLYQLIWNRFVACQMPPAEFDQTTVTIAAPTKEGDAVFRATGRKLVFDGFMKVAGVSSEDQLLPELSEEQAGLPDRDRADAALHPAAAAVHRGEPGEGAGAAGHRPAEHVREHHPDDPGPRVRRCSRTAASTRRCSARSSPTS